MHSIWVHTDDHLQHYPHFFTSPDIWDASILDHCITPALLEEIHQEADGSLLQDFMFDEFGDNHQQVVQLFNVFWDSGPTQTGEHTFHTHLHQSNPAEEAWSSLRPYFGWQWLSKIPKRLPHGLEILSLDMNFLKRLFKSRNPVFNILRRNEPVATDTVFSDVET